MRMLDKSNKKAYILLVKIKQAKSRLQAFIQLIGNNELLTK